MDRPMIRMFREAHVSRYAGVLSLAAALTAFSLAGCSQTKNTGTDVSENGAAVGPIIAPQLAPSSVAGAIATRIDSRLAESRQMQGANVTATVDVHGAVILSGLVQNSQQRRLAVRVADDTPGVRTVNDRIAIRGADSVAEGIYAADTRSGAKSRHFASAGGDSSDSTAGEGSSMGSVESVDGTDNASGSGSASAAQVPGYDAVGATRADGTLYAAAGNGGDSSGGDPSQNPENSGVPALDRNATGTAGSDAAAGGNVAMANRNDSSYYGLNSGTNSAYSGDPGSAVSRQGSNFATGNTYITGIGHTWGAVPHNASSDFAGTHSTTPH